MIRILFVLIGTLASWCISIGVSRFGHDSSRYDVPRHSNISNNENEVKNPLDKVLIGYDKRVRPYSGSGRPVTVGVSAYVLSISSISEVDMVIQHILNSMKLDEVLVHINYYNFTHFHWIQKQKFFFNDTFNRQYVH